MGSIGVGFGFEVGAAPSTGVGFGFGKPLREELAGEGVVCAFTTASSRLFLNFQRCFFLVLFLQEEHPAKAEKNYHKNGILNHRKQRNNELYATCA